MCCCRFYHFGFFATSSYPTQESSVWPSASYTSILLTPSIAHLPLENQEVTLTQGQLPRIEVDKKVQELGGSQIDTSNLGHLPLENQDYDMLEQNPNVSHFQPESHMEVEEEMVDLPGPLPEVIVTQIS